MNTYTCYMWHEINYTYSQFQLYIKFIKQYCDKKCTNSLSFITIQKFEQYGKIRRSAEFVILKQKHNITTVLPYVIYTVRGEGCQHPLSIVSP